MTTSVQTLIVTVTEDADGASSSKVAQLAGEYNEAGEHNERSFYTQAQASNGDQEQSQDKKMNLYWDGSGGWWFGTLLGGWGTGIAWAPGQKEEVPATGWQTRAFFGKTPCPALSVAPKPVPQPVARQDSSPRCGGGVGCGGGVAAALKRKGSICGSSGTRTVDGASPVSDGRQSPSAPARAREWAKTRTRSFADSAKSVHDRHWPVVRDKGTEIAASAKAAHERHWPVVRAKGVEYAQSAKEAGERHWPVVKARTVEFATMAHESAKQKATDLHAWANHPDTRSFFKGLADSVWDVVTNTAQACNAPTREQHEVQVSSGASPAAGGDSATASASHSAAHSSAAASNGAAAKAADSNSPTPQPEPQAAQPAA